MSLYTIFHRGADVRGGKCPTLTFNIDGISNNPVSCQKIQCYLGLHCLSRPVSPKSMENYISKVNYRVHCN